MSGSQDEIPPPPPPPSSSQTPTQQTPHTVSTIKLPILKKGEYDIWAMKMEHYLAHTDYPIWEVIQNGNGPVSITTDTQGQIKVLPPRTAEEILARERERKARTTLLMALPEDHLAKFHKMTDAKEMWDAIKSRFGGNDESKKMQKYILKQQFEGFSVSNSEGLHKGYDRFQSLLSQLEIHGAGVSTEDANQKFLRSLPSAWSQVSLIMRTKPGVDSLSFDDLYNNLRVFENDVKGSTASSSSTQNVAFVSENTSSTNDVSTAYSVSNTSGQNSQYEQTSSYSLLANQSSCPQLDHEDLEQLDEFDLEEMDLKWQVAMISMRTKKFYKKTGRKLQFDAKEPVGFGKTKKRRDAWNSGNKDGRRSGKQEDSKALVTIDGEGGMQFVPPPMTGNYMPSGPDVEIDYSQFTYGPNQSQPSESETQTSDFDTCESDYIKMSMCLNLQRTEQPSFASTTKQVKTPRETVKNQFTHSKNSTVDKKGLGYGLLQEHVLYVEVNTAEVNAVSAVGGKRETADYPHRALKHKGIIDSGSFHAHTGNKANLADNSNTLMKGKQHKASCKAKSVSSISHSLQLLHMDLFGPTSVRSLNHKTYCLVITDDFSRFSWVFFLRTKDETSGILKDFIRQIENQLNQKVKTIRCDNGTEFKNRDFIELCRSKGIKREYSNARTPQQNGVAERKNMTLIEAARTMLADSFLPNTFWAEAVSTACYVLNRVLVTKPHNKTPYELVTGKIPIISYIRPFGCHVTILNTIDHLGKFDGKSDEGFLVGYSLQSKAFRVYNLDTKRVEENLHITFLENKPNVALARKIWHLSLRTPAVLTMLVPLIVFLILLVKTHSMNKHHNASTKDNIDVGDSEKEDESTQDYFVLPIWSSYSSTVKISTEKDAGEAPTKHPDLQTDENPVDKEDQVFLEELERLKRQEKEANDAAKALRKEIA
ncbi:ribonuclease H-like domain-containing protein [Tanacetum coccineum]